MVELEFEAIQPNPRTKQNTRSDSLDLKQYDGIYPKDVDSLKHVEMLFMHHQSKERSPQKNSQSFLKPK